MERATRIAREMVTRFGMSAKLGPIVYDDPTATGREARVSEQVAGEIDREVRRIVGEAYALASTTLTARRAALEAVTAALIDEESLDADAFLALCAGAPPAIAPAASGRASRRLRHRHDAPGRAAFSARLS
jgi:cell division protease FtsH